MTCFRTFFIQTCATTILLFHFACESNPNPEIPFEEAIVQDEINAMMLAYFQAIEANGLLAEFEFLDSSEHFFWVPPGFTEPLSFDSVKTILLERSKQMKGVKFSWESLDIHVLTRSTATYTGIVDAQMTDTTNTTSRVRLIESGTLIKRKDGWKLLSGQSAVLPK